MASSRQPARAACPVCHARQWDDFLITETGRVMTSDQRVIAGDLWKVRCTRCGLVANARPFAAGELQQLYSQEYELNTGGHEEHIFFTPTGPIARSELFLQRLQPHLPTRCRSVLEVGCGEGNLLARLAALLPSADVRGTDGSERAVALARSRGLNVTQVFIADETELPTADVVVCIGVLEHVEDPAGFLRQLRAAVNPGGRLIFSVPVQDQFSCDLFFHDHVWHLDAAQTVHLARANGLNVVVTECDHPLNNVMGLFVCERNEAWRAERTRYGWSAEPSEAALGGREAWLRVFDDLDTWLGRRRPARVAVFGGGETLALFWAFTALPDWPVAACLDDDPNKIGQQRQGVPIHPVRWLDDNPVDGVVLTANPMYQPRVSARLARQVNPESIFTWTVQETAAV